MRASNEVVEGEVKMHRLREVEPESRIKTTSDPGGLAGWLLRRLRRTDGSRAAIKQMHLVETLSLGGKRNLMLVSCAGELFLVGGSIEGVETIVRVNSESSRGVAAKKADHVCL
ncbi:flagellar biosynthetic protein FliO [Edaphobacter dinghuensis]|uniref:Flagellar biosynthesis protein FliO n=1 Tax=Edaphobacter dinghuensis TaxID=1560005 RepID=A0A917HKM3_9BACT|nr:flagellar biosynthetic protein FliO [Edaphobacter dinghuensis]GGG81719.1 hypothetical protein GCM10011585_26510 [Edaphobacter dinghuensis]